MQNKVLFIFRHHMLDQSASVKINLFIIFHLDSAWTQPAVDIYEQVLTASVRVDR
jgi:hypothetical protein